MRRTAIFALVVLALAAGIVSSGATAVNAAVRDAGALLQRAETAICRGDGPEAVRAIDALDGYWRERVRMLEALTSHDVLYDVRDAIGDAALCLANGDSQECLRALTGAGAALERIRVAEAVRWMNLF